MSLIRKVKQISANATQAADVVGTHILDHDVFAEEGGYIFSWIIGDKPLLLMMKTEGVHIGFAMTEAEIQEEYHVLDVPYFVYLFRSELAKHKDAAPAIELDKETYADNDNGLTPVTIEDLEGKNETSEET